MKKIEPKYELTKEEVKAVYDWLDFKISYRELGTRLGISHQGSINVLPLILREWIRSGEINVSKFNSKK